MAAWGNVAACHRTILSVEFDEMKVEMTRLEKLNRRLARRWYELNVAWQDYICEVVNECSRSDGPPDPHSGNLPAAWNTFLEKLSEVGCVGRGIIDQFRTKPTEGHSHDIMRAAILGNQWIDKNTGDPEGVQLCLMLSLYLGPRRVLTAKGITWDYWAEMAIRHVLSSPELPRRPAPLNLLLIAYVLEIG